MRTRALKVCLLLCALLVALPASGAEKTSKPSKSKGKASKEKAEEKTLFKAETFTGLSFRGIGPAVTSGRVGDLAVHPTDRSTWYVAVASGGVWKTTNAGTTWSPIFDGEGSYSIGCVTLDPKNPLVVWVGTGENNSQRSVGYGNGVYKSTDGGKSWENVGLKASEHIAKILIDPRDSNVVYVAAQGPLWSAGGDRWTNNSPAPLAIKSTPIARRNACGSRRSCSLSPRIVPTVTGSNAATISTKSSKRNTPAAT
jgi:photosystem II stability/assembly factor-like uncharacterized protein